jgi:hypothetical protein
MRPILTILAAAILIATTAPTLAHTPAEAASDVHASALNNAALDYLSETLLYSDELYETIYQLINYGDWYKTQTGFPDFTPEQKNIIKGYRGTIERLQIASKLPDCDFGIDERLGIDALLPHLQPHKKHCNLLFLDAAIKIQEGDLDGAIENTATILRMAKHLGSADNFLISSLVASSEFNLVARLLRHIPTIQLQPVHKRTIESALASLPENDPLQFRQHCIEDVQLVSTWLQNNTAGKSPVELRAFFEDMLENYPDSPPLSPQDWNNLTDPTQLASFIDLYASLDTLINANWMSDDPTTALAALENQKSSGDLGVIAKLFVGNYSHIYKNQLELEAKHQVIRKLINE